MWGASSSFSPPWMIERLCRNFILYKKFSPSHDRNAHKTS